MNSWFEISLPLKLKRFKQIFQIFKIFWMREMTLQIFGSWPEIFADVSLWTEVERSRRLAWIWNFLFYGRLVAKLGGCSSGQKFDKSMRHSKFSSHFHVLGQALSQHRVDSIWEGTPVTMSYFNKALWRYCKVKFWSLKSLNKVNL